MFSGFNLISLLLASLMVNGVEAAPAIERRAIPTITKVNDKASCVGAGVLCFGSYYRMASTATVPVNFQITVNGTNLSANLERYQKYFKISGLTTAPTTITLRNSLSNAHVVIDPDSWNYNATDYGRPEIVTFNSDPNNMIDFAANITRSAYLSNGIYPDAAIYNIQLNTNRVTSDDCSDFTKSLFCFEAKGSSTLSQGRFFPVLYYNYTSDGQTISKGIALTTDSSRVSIPYNGLSYPMNLTMRLVYPGALSSNIGTNLKTFINSKTFMISGASFDNSASLIASGAAIQADGWADMKNIVTWFAPAVSPCSSGQLCLQLKTDQVSTNAISITAGLSDTFTTTLTTSFRWYVFPMTGACSGLSLNLPAGYGSVTFMAARFGLFYCNDIGNTLDSYNSNRLSPVDLKTLDPAYSIPFNSMPNNLVFTLTPSSPYTVYRSFIGSQKIYV